MPTHLSFADQYRYPETEFGITIPVLLGYNQKIITVTAKVELVRKSVSSPASMVRDSDYQLKKDYPLR